MPQRQLNIQGIGSAREAWTEGLLGRIASMIPVQREHDYGIDYYCLPRAKLGKGLETVVALAGVQVKGLTEPFVEFGGSDAKTGSWNKHELDWFRNLGHPFYLAIADEANERVNVYAVSRAVQVFWKTSYPFRIRCVATSIDRAAMHEAKEPDGTQRVPATADHDGKEWTVDLGGPFLSLKLAEFAKPEQVELVRNTLLVWMNIDRYSLELFAMQVPEIRQVMQYYTNIPAPYVQVIQFQAPDHASRARDIAARLAPGLETLTSQLVSESKLEEAKMWCGALQWCDRVEVLSELGKRTLSLLGCP